MSTYAIGDVQGCCHELEQLLELVDFDPGEDRVWFVGDLVNRGPESLEVLRLVEKLGDSAVSVLGNHDLHLIACALGVRERKRTDTLVRVLRSKDRKRLIEWLRHRPLLHNDGGYVLVHAGLAPQWTVRRAQTLAKEVEQALRGKDAEEVLGLYAKGSVWPPWRAGLPRKLRVVTALKYFTRVRCLRHSGRPDDHFSGPPYLRPRGLVPWFDFEGRRATRTTVVFGHWAALGLRVDRHMIALDTGCVWGRALTAVRLEDRAVFQVSARRDL